MRPRLLDLFSGAGGAAVGYHRAGFEVVGVDHVAQPNYPFEFTQDDALEYLRDYINHGPLFGIAYDAIHASPPCQAFTAYKRTGNVGEHPDLIQPVRELLDATGLPYVIENVASAPLDDPVILCGSMFDLDVQRHRLFETNWALEPPIWPCRHKIWAPRFPASTNRSSGSRLTAAIGQWGVPFDRQEAAIGIDWMSLEEMSEAIPPAYTEFIGTQLHSHLNAGQTEAEATVNS